MRQIVKRAFTVILALVPILAVLDIFVHFARQSDWDIEAAKEVAATYDVEIIRDAYGVPHIYGKRDADVAFGLAYAHAEDDFATMQSLIPFYRGALARNIGFDGLPIDFLVQWLDVRAHVAENYETALSPEIRAHLKAYADGLNYYAATHPFEADARLFPMTPQDLVTGFSLQHLLFYGFEAHLDGSRSRFQ